MSVSKIFNPAFVRPGLARTLAVVVFLGLSTAGRAQDIWTPALQEVTRANLWSIAHGSGTVVAVGEQGTIISAGTEDYGWFQRDSAVSTWLVGVGYGNGRFIAVGDRGTILTSDDNGLTWIQRDSGTTTRLNAVAYGGGRWLAVGEQGSVLVSSDGTSWQSRPTLGAGFLRALAYGQDAFFIGGAGGKLFTTTDATTFTPLAVPATSDIESIGVSATHVWVAGSAGLLATLTATTWTVDPTGYASTFRGLAVRSVNEAAVVGERDASIYKLGAWWRVVAPPFLATAVVRTETELVAVGFNGGVARAGLTSAPSISLGNQASYGTTVVDYGSTVRLEGRTESFPASSHQWFHAGSSLPGATQTTLTLPEVGPEDAGSYTLRYIQPNGTFNTAQLNLVVMPGGRPEVRDRSFAPALAGAPSLVVPQPDGKLLVVGLISIAADGSVRRGLARLTVNGSLDPEFRLHELPLQASIAGLERASDGSIYLRGSFTSLAGQPRPGLARLLPDGQLDPNFNPDPLLAFPTFFALAPDGGLYVQHSEAGAQAISRVAANGSRDPTFGALRDYRLIGVDPRSRVLVTTFTSSYFDQSPRILQRYLPNGLRDSGYTPAPTVAYTGVTQSADDFAATRITDEGLYAASRSSSRFFSGYRFIRFKPDGGIDPTYSSPPGISFAQTGRSGPSFAYAPDGSLWISQVQANSELQSSVEFYDTNGERRHNRYAMTGDASPFRIVAFAVDGSLFTLNRVGQAGESLVRIRPITGLTGRLTNLSVRAFVLGAGEPLIAGFVTAGTGETRALVRAIGPGLRAFGVDDALTDPRLVLVRDGATIDQNDNWNASLSARFAENGAFALAAASTDAALESAILDGNYTGVVAAPPSDTGTALLELYESTGSRTSIRHFVNISARGPVAPNRPLIVGFGISGDVPISVLIRGAGPALSAFGVNGPLADPQLMLYRGGAPLWENGDWSSDSSEAAMLTAAFEATGAFRFGSGSKDAAMQVVLAPGSYTAVISGVNNASGSALVEIYELPRN